MCVRERESECEWVGHDLRPTRPGTQRPPRPGKSGVRLATSSQEDFSWLWSETCLVSDEGQGMSIEEELCVCACVCVCVCVCVCACACVCVYLVHCMCNVLYN